MLVPFVVTVAAVSLSLLTGNATTFTAVPLGGVLPYSGAWTFGDGSTGTGLIVSHTFSSAGNFSVSCTVTDLLGETASGSLAVTVAAATSGGSTGTGTGGSSGGGSTGGSGGTTGSGGGSTSGTGSGTSSTGGGTGTTGGGGSTTGTGGGTSSGSSGTGTGSTGSGSSGTGTGGTGSGSTTGSSGGNPGSTSGSGTSPSNPSGSPTGGHSAPTRPPTQIATPSPPATHGFTGQSGLLSALGLFAVFVIGILMLLGFSRYLGRRAKTPPPGPTNADFKLATAQRDEMDGSSPPKDS